MGIGSKGRVDSLGKIKIGSTFSNMREMPEVVGYEDSADLSAEKFQQYVQGSLNHQEGLYMSADDDIMIDNL